MKRSSEQEAQAPDISSVEQIEEKPDGWWRRVYLVVILVTILVIASLGVFTRYFSG